MTLASTTMTSKRTVLFAFVVLLLLVTAFIVSNSFFQLVMVDGPSMEPSLHNNQIVLLNRRHTELSRGDIIVFVSEKAGNTLIKRIAGLPGDVLIIEDGTLLINGERSPYWEEQSISYAGKLECAYSVPEGCCFVLGDNTAESVDSRDDTIGDVLIDSVLGVVLGVE